MGITAIAIALTVGSGAACAAPDLSISQPADTAAYEMETLVVTATRTPKLLKDTPVVTRVLTARDIRRSAQPDISGLLQQQLPGVEFSFGMGQNTQINFSGFGGGGVLFLLDGERMAGETLDNPDYSRLNLQNVERVEIVKGAASSLYGSNATGGVVNIISPRPAEGFGLRLDGRYGSHSRQSYGGVASYGRGRLANSLEARYDSHAEIRFPRRGDFTRDYATRSWSIRDRLILTFSPEAELTARAGFFRRQRNSTLEAYDRYSDISAGIRGRWRDWTASYAFDCYDKSDYILPTGREERDYRNRQHMLHLQYSHDFDRHGTLTAGADWTDDFLHSYEFGHAAYTQTNLDSYLQWDWHATEKLWLVPGLRYDWFSASGARRVSPKLSLLWREGNCSLRANYAAGFRAPTLKELYMDFDMAGVFHVYGNPDLNSETSQNFSISAEYMKGARNLTATIFHNLIENRISYLWNEALRGQQYLNLRKMHVSGAEISAMYAFRFGLSLHADYIFTLEKYSRGDLRANPTRPHAATLKADWTRTWRPAWQTSATLHAKWLSAVTGDVLSFFSQEATRRQRYPAYALLGLNLSQTLPCGFTLGITVDNILNYIPKYYYYNSPLTTGTTFSASISWTL